MENNNDLSEWIKRLTSAAKKERHAIVEELSKVLGLSIDDTWKKIQEAGLNEQGKTPPGPAPEGDNPKLTVSIRHKTTYPLYRRAGIVLTNLFKPYEVTAKQLTNLKKDPWVEIGKE